MERFNIVVRSEASEDMRQFVHELGSVHFDRVSTSFEVGDLVPGMGYLVEISAVNEAGEGVSSEQRPFWTHAAREWLYAPTYKSPPCGVVHVHHQSM